VDEITPAVGDGVVVAEENTTGFGVAKFAWFRILKNSARNCKLTLSDTRAFFNTDKSSSANPGPVKVSWPFDPEPSMPIQVAECGYSRQVGF